MGAYSGLYGNKKGRYFAQKLLTQTFPDLWYKNHHGQIDTSPQNPRTHARTQTHTHTHTQLPPLTFS